MYAGIFLVKEPEAASVTRKTRPSSVLGSRRRTDARALDCARYLFVRRVRSLSVPRLFRVRLLSLLALVIALVSVSGIAWAAPITVSTSTSQQATDLGYQRKTFRDTGGYFWAFYFNGTSTYLERSNDTTGAAWTGTPELLYAGQVRPSVWLDVDTVYVALSSGGDVLVRRGVVSGGAISWSSFYVAMDGDGSVSYSIATTCKGSDGFLWVAARAQAGTSYYGCAARSSVPYSVDSWLAPETITATSSSGSLYTLVLNLADGAIYALWSRNNQLEGRRYTSGTGWAATITSIDSHYPNDTQMLFSALSDSEGRIHLVYVVPDRRLSYRRLEGTTWGSTQELEMLDTAGSHSPNISINPSEDRLYAILVKSRQVECKSAILPSDRNDWVDEHLPAQTTNKYYVTSCYGSQTRVTWLYAAGNSAPFSVMTDGLAVPTISIYVTESLFAFGSQLLNTWLAAESTLVVNDGTCSEDMYVCLYQFVSGPYVWGISDLANGPDVCRAQWSVASSAGPWNNIAVYDSRFLLATDVAVGSSVKFYFRIQTPTATSSHDQYLAAMKVRAEAH
jgi:hypothetical protein